MNPTLTSGREEGLEVSPVTNGQCSNQPRLCNEASIKIQKHRVQRASGMVSIQGFGESGVNVWRFGESGAL